MDSIIVLALFAIAFVASVDVNGEYREKEEMIREHKYAIGMYMPWR